MNEKLLSSYVQHTNAPTIAFVKTKENVILTVFSFLHRDRQRNIYVIRSANKSLLFRAFSQTIIFCLCEWDTQSTIYLAPFCEFRKNKYKTKNLKIFDFIYIFE